MGRSSLLILAGLVVSCATSSIVDTAYHGDLASLKLEIARARGAGELSEDVVRDVAQAVALRELRAAGPDHAVERVDAIRPCATSLLSGLRARAEQSDDAAAEATGVLLSLGKIDSESLVSSYATADSGAWRALAARGTAGEPHAALRRRFFEDADARVRRGALEAALSAPAVGDLEALLPAARLDPDPLARSLAIRTLGALGSERAVLALQDLWRKGDEQDRLVIIEAWAATAAQAAGGTRRLVRVVENETGLVRVAAAAALALRTDEPGVLGRGVIVRAVRAGAADERRLAILSTPLDGDGVAALEAAAAEVEAAVAVVAHARLLEHAPAHAKALDALRRIARGSDAAAFQARVALAAAGDASPAPRLEKELVGASPQIRRSAALALIRLERWGAGATGLADPDVGVRLAVACAVLNRT